MNCFDDYIEQEDKKHKEFNELVRKNTDLFKFLWSAGDGKGGFIFGTIRQAVTGDFFDQKTESKAYSKKKISNSLRKSVFERDGYRCKHCGSYIDLCVDHIYPETKGGNLELNNLQTLCRPCNSKKGAKV